MATADAALAAGAIGAPEATAGLVAPERGNLADARRAIDAMTEDRGPDLTMVPKSSSAFLGAQIDLPAP
ncbi:MAG TPA: hypothetical protein VHH36_04050 [Candidatus Thermoplasmatota archaeon]|nr:hypothetical protein [Candidatus Thermoplasmatota archaeon]